MKLLKYLIWSLIFAALVNIDFSQKGLLKTIKEMPYCSEGVLDWNENNKLDESDLYFFSVDLDGD